MGTTTKKDLLALLSATIITGQLLLGAHRTYSITGRSLDNRLRGLGYDRNRIIRPETGTELDLWFRLNGTGMAFQNSGSFRMK